MDRWKGARILPGHPAPEAGMYEEHTSSGEATGMSVMADKGHRLPSLPRGFFWRLARGRLISLGNVLRPARCPKA